MKIIVCLKQVPAPDAPLRVEPGNAWISESDTLFETNEADLHALEAGLQLRDLAGGEVVVLSLGPERAARSLRDALAKGADRAIHVLDDKPAIRDPLEIARLLATVMTGESFDLVLAGLQSDDAGYGQTGALLAEILGLPHAGIVTGIQPGASGLTVTQELGGGWLQEIGMPLPALLAVQAGINKPRYAGMKGIMAAKKKEIRTVNVADINAGESLTYLQSIDLYPPPVRKSIEFLEGAPADIARQLHTRLSTILPRT